MARVRTLLGISVFWLALGILGDGFAVLVVPQRVALLADPGLAGTAVGLITGIGLLAGMLVQPVAGALSDRLRARIGRRGFLLIGVTLILLALAAFTALDNLIGVLVAFVALMIAASVAQAAQQALMPDLIERDWRGRASGLKGLADVGGAFVGFLLLGALLVGGELAPAIIAVAAVVIATALLTVVLVREPANGWTAGNRVGLLDSFALDRRRHAPFVSVVVARFRFLLGIFAVGRFFLLFVGERLGLPPDEATAVAGGLLAALALITALAAVPAGWLADRWGRGATMLAGIALSAAGVALLLGAWSFETILLTGGLMALGSAAFSSANWALAADLAPAAEAARFLGIANFGTAGAAAAAGLVGPVSDLLRAIQPALGHGAVMIVALLPLALSVLAVRPLLAAHDGQQTKTAEEIAV